MHKAAQKYLATQVTTTDQGQLLILLYDAAIKFLNQAKLMIDEKNYAQKGILIAKALDILSELASSLNKDKGGELADSLNQLYFYCNTRLLMANLKMDKAIIDEVVKIISGVRDAYAQIIKDGAAAPDSPVDRAGTQAVSRSSPFGAPRVPGLSPTPRPTDAPKPQATKPAAPTQTATPKAEPGEAAAKAAPEQRPEEPEGQTQSDVPTELPAQSPGQVLRRRMVQAYGNTPK